MEIIMLSIVSQTEKVLHVLSYMWSLEEKRSESRQTIMDMEGET
jgi:hypothetical protein